MSRLIDADALIETLEEYIFGWVTHEIEREYVKETIIDIVKTEPTAYNMIDEKVLIERLEECRQCIKRQMKHTGVTNYLIGKDDGYKAAIEYAQEMADDLLKLHKSLCE